MKPLERLFEREGLPYGKLPATLAEIYDGGFSLDRPGLYANFVSSVDGVVAIPGGGESGHIISGNDEPDRFIMGMLRAFADAVLIGAGTFRKANGSLWHPEAIYPSAAEGFAELRQYIGLRPHPLLVVVTASGRIDVTQPSLHDALIITTRQGETRLRGSLPAGARVHAFDSYHISGCSMLEVLHAQGLQIILTEGGPTLVGQLLEEGLINELFLTISPHLFGRKSGDERKSLAEGVDLSGRSMKLSSVRRHESHLYLRYAL